MKKIVLAALVIFSIGSIDKIQAQNGPEAAAYMDKLSNPLISLKSETWEYLKAVTKNKGARKIENKRLNLINVVKNAKTETSKASAYKGDASYKNEITAYLDLLYSVLKEDYDKILNMEDIAEQSYDMMEAYLLAKEKAGDKLKEASEKLNQAQKDFASKNNVNLIEGGNDETSKNIEKASKMLEYYNKVYLIFFKSYKEEAYIMVAQQNGDVNALEQHSGTLASFSEEGLTKLKALGGYQGDIKLVESAKRMMAFYKKEAEKDFPTLVDFYVKKANFEKVKKIFDSKGKNKTQEDVDQYNNALKEYNDAVAKYNQVNQLGNTERNKNIEDWNKKVEAFFEAHS